MTIEERLVQLNKIQAKLLAEYYSASKALERADEGIRNVSQQIQLLAHYEEQPDGAAE